MRAMKNIGWIICIAVSLLAGCKKERTNPLLMEDNIQHIRNHIDIYMSFTDNTFEKECALYLAGKEQLSGKAKTRCDEGVEELLKGFSRTSVGEPSTKADRADANLWRRVFGFSDEG